MRALTKNSDIEQKSGTLEQAGMRYGFGRNSMRKIAENAGDIIKIGKVSVSILRSLINIWMLYQVSNQIKCNNENTLQSGATLKRAI